MTTGDKPSNVAPRVVADSAPGALWQSRVNLGVWFPFLGSPALNVRRVTYDGREVSEGGRWAVVLPSQCWCCGTRQRLKQIQSLRDVRTFDVPPPLLLLGAITAAVLILLGLFFKSVVTFALGAFLVPAAAGLLVLRSWTEPVKVTMATCEMHAAEARFPDLALFENELYLYAPTATLAEAACAELVAKRRQGSRYNADAAEREAPSARDERTERAAADDTQPFTPGPRPLREELPPIKFDE
jgi:hypothetical protein